MKQPTASCASEFGRTTHVTPVRGEQGEFSAELDGGLVGGSFQTRLTTTG